MKNVVKNPAFTLGRNIPRPVQVRRADFDGALRACRSRSVERWEAEEVLCLTEKQVDLLEQAGQIFYVDHLDPATRRREEHYYFAHYRLTHVEVSRLPPPSPEQRAARAAQGMRAVKRERYRMHAVFETKRTHSCGELVLYSALENTYASVGHDAYFCPRCDLWLEGACTDGRCRYCADRPHRPSLVGPLEGFTCTFL